ncbi:hypothetical protein [Vibrio lentus]|uniref:hypothetical protein n=1 Tax=Vibrio lentus TaxID=136468 RepID=UPI00178CBA5D|nr:hypothetical protein [Vibrio lentus]MDN3630546.1 hypothetical protein [Vibrio lentus]
MRIDIFSDIPYDYYQHVNQAIFRHYHNSGYNARFFEKIFLHNPTLSRFKKLVSDVSFNNEGASNLKLVSIKGLPSINTFFDYFYSIFLINKHNIEGDICITFVASKLAINIFNRYNKKIYYCVHDYESQGLSQRKINQEKVVVESCDVVFCDNNDVLERLSNGQHWVHLFNSKKGDKYILVPPLVNELFYNLSNESLDFDFCYFGTLHKDIDVELLRKIAISGKKVLIIGDCTDGLVDLVNIVFSKPTSNIKELTNLISRSEAILLPYKNSDFMKTVTPAKVLQSLATKKKVLTSNRRISDLYGIDYLNEDLSESSVDDLYEDITIFSEKNILNKISKVV